jgi:hypothetical protein
MKFLYSVFFIFFPAASSWAASCCGSSQAFPTLLMGDEKVQTQISLSRSKITDEALGNGKWMRRADQNQTETFKIESAFLVTDRWQMGIGIPFAQKKDQTGSDSWKIADANLVLADETWPETTYSWWRPKGVSFIQITAPSGESLYDDSSNLFLDTRGRGLWSLGTGVAFVKRTPRWDFFANLELHRSFERSSQDSRGETYRVVPGWGLSSNLGLGLSQGPLRYGSSVGFLYEDPLEIRGANSSSGTLQRNMSLAASLSYMLSDEEGISFSWSNQALLGAPVNSSLAEAWALSYSHRWMR